MASISFEDAAARSSRQHERTDTVGSMGSLAVPGGPPTADSHSLGLNGRYAQALREEQDFDPVRGAEPAAEAHSGPTKANGFEHSADTSEAEPERDEFNWDESDDSELDEVEREEKRRRADRAKDLDHDLHIKRARRLRRVCLAFNMLARPIRTGLLLLIGSGLLISPAIVVWTRFPTTSVRPHVLAWSIWASVAWAASCLTSIVVDFFPSLIIKLVPVVYGSTPEGVKTQVELWMGVKFWIKLALSLTWDWVAFIVIVNDFFGSQRDGSLAYFTWVIKANAALFATGIVLLVEKIVLQMIKLNFHRTSLAGRLEENARALWALDKLAAAKDIRRTPKRRRFGAFTSSRGNSRRPSFEGPSHDRSRSGQATPRPLANGTEPVVINMPEPPTAARTKGLFRRRSRTEAELDQNTGGINAGSLAIELNKAKNEQQMDSGSRSGSGSPRVHYRPGHGKRPSASRRSSTFHPKEFAEQLTHALGKAALRHGTTADKSGFGSTHSAKKLARKLFEGLDEDQGGCITKNEFEPFFRNARDAEMAFAIFDKDGNGDIDKKEMRSAVQRIYRERKALATSLKDMSSAVSKLDAVFLAVCLLIVIFIWLFIFNPDGTTSQLVPIATIVLGFSFVFGNSSKNLFESMLFIFSIHCFDCGDLVFIDDQPLVVQAFGLFSTTFKRVDGQVMTAPNSLLGSSKYILNVTRSGPMWETTNIQLAFDTPFAVIQEVRTRLRQYVADNPREWRGGLEVNVDFMENQNMTQLIVAMEHKSNWSDWGARWNRRTLLMKELKTILDDLEVTYRLPPQPVRFIAKGGPAPFRPGMQRSNSSLSPRSPGGRGGGAGPGGRDAFGNAGTSGMSAQPFTAPQGTIPTLRVDTAQTFRSGSGIGG